MPVHDWTRVDAGIFHAFHDDWITDISRALNRGVLSVCLGRYADLLARCLECGVEEADFPLTSAINSPPNTTDPSG